MRRTRFGDLSIRGKLTALTVLSSVVGLLLAAAALIAYAWSSARAGYDRDLETVAQMLSGNSTAALVFRDRKAAAENLAVLRAKPEIRLACLYSSAEAGIFGSYAGADSGACPDLPETPGLHQEATVQTLVQTVDLAGERVGTLRLTQTLQPLRDTLMGQVAITFSILALSFGVSLAIAWIMQGSISAPIVALASTARRVTETRDYELRADGGGHDEVGRLVEDFNRMLNRIAFNEREVSQARDALEREVAQKTRANAELEQALQRLRDTQAQLVQSEKLASLGALVAGVAHEINTPVGVGVTAASTLAARAAQLRERYSSDTLTRSDLERFVAVAEESTRILLANLNRAADLIHSFKQVAVDQSSGERRRFDLKKYLEEVLASLNPQLRRPGHSVSIDCPEGIEVDGYPGALAQIITNFVTNSLLHAYAPGQRGQIRIQARAQDGSIELHYRDDGHGMPPEDLARIFDPFFTTKRGTGGSGLGMHIVYNLVTQMLGGQISVNSAPGQGVEFRVTFPGRRKEPDHDRNIAVRA